MAYQTGTATNAADLYSKLIAFLTTNADRVADGEAWTVGWTHASGQQAGVIMVGPGLAGQDEICVGLSLSSNSTTDEYWIQIQGMTGILGTATTMAGHVNVSPRFVRTFVDSQPMTYWFIASGRRFIVIVKISTVFESLYAGLFIPYANPLKYAYPLLIGGSAGPDFSAAGTESWRSTYINHQAFPFAHLTDADPSSCHFITPAGEWKSVCGYNGNLPSVMQAIFHPHVERDAYSYFPGASYNVGIGPSYGQVNVHSAMVANSGDPLPLTHLHIVQIDTQAEVYGILDGVFSVPGFFNASQNIITDQDGVDNLVVQNTYRTGTDQYFAVRLE